ARAVRAAADFLDEAGAGERGGVVGSGHRAWGARPAARRAEFGNGCTEYRTGALAHAPAAHGATLWFPGGAPAHASAEYDIKRDDP
ncbi:hypothetical protein KDW38_16330, partial [Burkholderia multivorans]|nr:hypothetical protein [Burkholderia multivorans]